MDKIARKALKTGVDERNRRLYYVCPECGWTISLMPKRCPKCGKRRPKDAYDRAIACREEAIMEAKMKELPKVYADRRVDKVPQPNQPRFTSSNLDLVMKSCYANKPLAELGIPKYYTTDEYGRISEAPVCYTTIGNGGPVAIPKPTQTIQTESVQVPVNMGR